MTEAVQSPPAPAAATSQWVGYACGIATALIWGIQAVVSRQSVADGLSSADVAILRFLTAAVCLLPLGLARLKPFPVGRLGWKRSLILTLFAGAPFSFVLVGGSTFAPALHTAVIAPSLIPVIAGVLAYIAAGDRPPPMRILGLALIVAGIGLFFWHSSTAGAIGPGVWRGDLMFVLAAAMWSIFGLLAKRWEADALDITITLSMLSVVLMPLLALVAPVHIGAASWSAIALQAIYQGLLVGVASVFLYAKANTLLGAARAALFPPLVPVVTLAAGAVLIGERPAFVEIAGMAVVMVGMIVAIRADMRKS